MGPIFALLVLAAAAFWLFGRRAMRDAPDLPGLAPEATFRVRFRAGRLDSVEGRIGRTTLSAFEDIAAHAGLDGEIRLAGPADLRFSDDVPAPVRQQFRNAYVTSVHVH